MHIQVNGEDREMPEALSLEELASRLELAAERIAIELNRVVVRRSEWREIRLQEGDRVEIVHFVGGGATRKAEGSRQ